jgi:hypothetical protein
MSVSNNRVSDNIIYIPTIKSCRDYGISRFPTRYNSSDGNGDGLPDFMSGGQFSNSQNPHINSINNVLTEGKDSNSMDEVLIEVLTNAPYVPELKKRVINGIEEWQETYSTEAEIPEFYLRIAPTWEDISQNKTHKWEASSGILSSILESVSSIVGGIEDFLVANRNSKSGNRKSAQAVKQNDIANQYKSTEKETLEIPFVLFTKDDFVNDIFYPIMMLTALSYPVRINLKKLQEKIMREASSSILSNDNIDENERTQLSSPDAIRNLMGDNRLFTSSPPPYLRVSHTSNLFFYPHMNITSFEYDFLTPFYNIKNNKMEDKSFPLMANCTLHLQASDLLLSDHYLNMIGRFANNNNSKIEISDTRIERPIIKEPEMVQEGRNNPINSNISGNRSRIGRNRRNRRNRQ